MGKKMIISDRIENYDKTEAVNAIRFTLYNDKYIDTEEVINVFNKILHENVLRICDEDDYDWAGRKYLIHEIIEPFDFLEADKIKEGFSKNTIVYFIKYWEDWGEGKTEHYLPTINLLKQFVEIEEE